jgi:hypothetical protein
MSIGWIKRREFYDKTPWALTTVIVITIAGPFLGLLVAGWPGVIIGLLLGAVTYFIGPYAMTKVREIERGGN